VRRPAIGSGYQPRHQPSPNASRSYRSAGGGHHYDGTADILTCRWSGDTVACLSWSESDSAGTTLAFGRSCWPGARRSRLSLTPRTAGIASVSAAAHVVSREISLSGMTISFQRHADELAVGAIENAGQGLNETIVPCLHSGAGKGGQLVRVAFPANLALIVVLRGDDGQLGCHRLATWQARVPTWLVAPAKVRKDYGDSDVLLTRQPPNVTFSAGEPGAKEGDWPVADAKPSEHSVPERTGPTRPRAGQLSARGTGQQPAQETTQSSSEQNRRGVSSAGNHPRRRRMPIPLILAIIGLALLPLAAWLLPGTDQQLAPQQAFVSITSDVPIQTALYQVDNEGPSLYLLIINLQASVYPDPANDHMELKVLLPPGLQFKPCSSPNSQCIGNPILSADSSQGPGVQATWQNLGFNHPYEYAEAQIMVQGQDFGYATNRTEESVSLPELYINHGSDNFPLSVTYWGLPSPQKYDWSSRPPSEETRSYSIWTEEVAGGYQPPEMAVGVDHSAQDQESTDTFLAGAIVGVAGAALIGALQEFLHLLADEPVTGRRRRFGASGERRVSPDE
jgi:hypothetical protein